MGTTEQRRLKTIRELLRKNDVKKALGLCQALNKQFPRNAEGWCAASVIACKLGNAPKGLAFVERALSIEPENTKFLIAQADAMVQSKQSKAAISIANVVAAKSSDDALMLDMAGGVLARCEEYVDAHDCYEKAVVLAPDNATLQFNLATVKRFLGKNDEAERCLDRVVELNPGDFEAYHLRSDLRTQTASRNHVEALKQKLQTPIDNWRGEMKLHFSLAKELEDLGHYKASFTSLRQGANLRRRHMSYRVQRDLDTIDCVISTYSPDAFRQIDPGCVDEQPIFIVGLPRTGTTLVDRILSSHDQVFAAGELNNFAVEMSRLARLEKHREASANLVTQSLTLDFSKLGEAYLSSTGTRRSGIRFVTDKLPLNFLYCGLIHKALPAAKIIHVTRNPMDACYAMYKRLFRDAYPMSYDLSDLGNYYLAYWKLMQHWYQLMPDAIYPVCYEDLVIHQEQTSRDLIAHCDLPWQDACLRFQENPAASTTASASQVRLPVYTSSIGKWRRYEMELKPLKFLLEKAGVDVDSKFSIATA